MREILFRHETLPWRFYVPAPTPEQERHRKAMQEADGMVRGNLTRLGSVHDKEGE
jgi:hypothetical protein